MIDLILGDCIDVIKKISANSVDCVITSPPYDDLRNYNNSLKWDLDVFKKVADGLYRVVADGGVVIWVVGDKTKKGSETGIVFYGNWF